MHEFTLFNHLPICLFSLSFYDLSSLIFLARFLPSFLLFAFIFLQFPLSYSLPSLTFLVTIFSFPFFPLTFSSFILSSILFEFPFTKMPKGETWIHLFSHNPPNTYEQTGSFDFGKVTSFNERKLWIQISFTSLINSPCEKKRKSWANIWTDVFLFFFLVFQIDSCRLKFYKHLDITTLLHKFFQQCTYLDSILDIETSLFYYISCSAMHMSEIKFLILKLKKNYVSVPALFALTFYMCVYWCTCMCVCVCRSKHIHTWIYGYMCVWKSVCVLWIKL